MKLKHYCPYCRNKFYFSKFRFLNGNSDIHVCPFCGLKMKLEHNSILAITWKLYLFISLLGFQFFGWPTILIPYKPIILFVGFILVIMEYLTSHFVAIE